MQDSAYSRSSSKVEWLCKKGTSEEDLQDICDFFRGVSDLHILNERLYL